MPASGKTEIRVLALFASPRKTGASSTIHESFLLALGPASIRRAYLYDMEIRPCTACGHCSAISECVFDDDMAPLYAELDKADLLSISMPLYFSGPPGPLKLFIDRTQVLWESARRAKRHREGPAIGNLICTGGARYTDMFLPSITIIRHFFNSIGFEYERSDFLLYPDMEGLSGANIPKKHLIRAGIAGEALGKRLKAACRCAQ